LPELLDDVRGNTMSLWNRIADKAGVDYWCHSRMVESIVPVISETFPVLSSTEGEAEPQSL
jgi:hypothetical protein